MSFIKIILIIVAVVNTANSQIDTAAIRLKVNSLKSIEDHSRFWDEAYAIDQKYRGKTTNDSIDKLNLIKCCVYLNRFGFPDKKILKSSIITIVWIHNKYPQVDLLNISHHYGRLQNHAN